MSDCCYCCSEQDEDKQILHQSNCKDRKQTVTTQPKSAQKYVVGTEESHVMNELEISKSDQISRERNLTDLQVTLDNQTQSPEAVVNQYKTEISELKTKKANLESKNNELLSRHKADVNKYEGKIIELKTKIDNLESKNNELLSRISAVASAKLTDNNPNIADLSDVNRPTKLSEQFSELYDNEWTDAIDALTSKERNEITEKKACKTLLEVKIYSTCRKKANDDLQQIEKIVTTFNGMEAPSTEVLKKLKDDRKKNYEGTLDQVKKDCESSLKDLIFREEASLITKFIEKCVSVCWLMAIQDPPVFMDLKIELHGEQLSTDIYKHYTQSGKTIDYLVWPALYLTEGGGILSKGIAQGKKEDSNQTLVVHF